MRWSTPNKCVSARPSVRLFVRLSVCLYVSFGRTGGWIGGGRRSSKDVSKISNDYFERKRCSGCILKYYIDGYCF